jgi:hypothetical protein
MKPRNEARIETTAQFIAAELKVLLDRYNYKSHLSAALKERCPAYKNGLTNEERELATLRALAITQIEITRDIASMTTAGDFDDVDDAA